MLIQVDIKAQLPYEVFTSTKFADGLVLETCIPRGGSTASSIAGENMGSI